MRIEKDFIVLCASCSNCPEISKVSDCIYKIEEKERNESITLTKEEILMLVEAMGILDKN